MSKHSFEMYASARTRRARRVVLPGVIILLALTAAFAPLNYLVPRLPHGARGPSVRIGWYLRSGQWHADVRTLAAAFQYVMDAYPGPATRTNSPTNWVAAVESEDGPNRPGVIRLWADAVAPSIVSIRSLCQTRPDLIRAMISHPSHVWIVGVL